MSDFSCVLGCSTPLIAPVNILYAFALLAGEGPFPISMVGWQNGAINDMEVGEEVLDMPLGIALVWLSVTEHKVYNLDVNFSPEFKKYISNCIKTGFRNRRGKNVTYTNFHVSMYPGGMVRFHLLSSIKIKCLDFSLCGDLTTKFDYAFLEQLPLSQNIVSIEERCKKYFQNDEELLKNAEFVKRQALPNNLWERYYDRFDYDIRFVFDDSDSYLFFWAPKFSNAESFSCQSGVNDDVVIKNPSTLCSLNLWWQNAQYRYTAYFYFKEEEILLLFEKRFRENHGQHGQFLIHVGKYNNSFEISLYFENGIYPLRETEIRVFRDPLSDLLSDSELIYKNYEGDHVNKFVGL